MGEEKKVTAIKIKENNTYSEEIPVGALAENVAYDENYSIKQVLGQVQMRKGNIQDQLNNYGNKIGDTVNDWMSDNITTSNSIILDKSLTQEGLAADAKAAGRLITIGDEPVGKTTKIKLKSTEDIYNILTTDDIDTTLTESGKVGDSKIIGDKLNEIENIMDETFLISDSIDCSIYKVNKQYYDVSPAVGQQISETPTTTTNADYWSVKCSCKKGDIFILNGRVGTATKPRLWAFVDNNFILLSKSANGVTATNLELIAPADGFLLVTYNLQAMQSAGITFSLYKQQKQYGIKTDKTLSIEGSAADAQTVGNNLNEIKENLYNFQKTGCVKIFTSDDFVSGNYAGRIIQNNPKKICTKTLFDVVQGDKLIIKSNPDNLYYGFGVYEEGVNSSSGYTGMLTGENIEYNFNYTGKAFIQIQNAVTENVSTNITPADMTIQIALKTGFNLQLDAIESNIDNFQTKIKITDRDTPYVLVKDTSSSVTISTALGVDLFKNTLVLDGRNPSDSKYIYIKASGTPTRTISSDTVTTFTTPLTLDATHTYLAVLKPKKGVDFTLEGNISVSIYYPGTATSIGTWAYLNNVFYRMFTPTMPEVHYIVLAHPSTTFENIAFQFELLDITPNSFINFNNNNVLNVHKKEQAKAAILNKQRISSEHCSQAAFRFLFFTDVHLGTPQDAKFIKRRLQRTIALLNGWGTKYFDFAINGGDTTASVYNSEQLTQYDSIIKESNIPILNTIGNHDVYSTLSGARPLVSATTAYNSITGKVKENVPSIVQPENAESLGLNYYYYDIETSDKNNDGISQSLRVIILDCMYWNPNNDNAQLLWFKQVLNDAATNSKLVIAVSHYNFASKYVDYVNSNWNPKASGGYGVGGSEGTYEMPIAAAQAVKEFEDNGGTFVTWLCGHSHGDSIKKLKPEYGLQYQIICPTFTNRACTLFKSENESDYNFDCLTYFTIDPYYKLLKGLRIGANINSLGQEYNTFAFSYNTGIFMDALDITKNNIENTLALVTDIPVDIFTVTSGVNQTKSNLTYYTESPNKLVLYGTTGSDTTSRITAFLGQNNYATVGGGTPSKNIQEGTYSIIINGAIADTAEVFYTESSYNYGIKINSGDTLNVGSNGGCIYVRVKANRNLGTAEQPTIITVNLYEGITTGIPTAIDVVARNNIEKILQTPTIDGTYVLKARVSNGEITYSWEIEN